MVTSGGNVVIRTAWKVLFLHLILRLVGCHLYFGLIHFTVFFQITSTRSHTAVAAAVDDELEDETERYAEEQRVAEERAEASRIAHEQTEKQRAEKERMKQEQASRARAAAASADVDRKRREKKAAAEAEAERRRQQEATQATEEAKQTEPAVKSERRPSYVSFFPEIFNMDDDCNLWEAEAPNRTVIPRLLVDRLTANVVSI
jgi:hypothetical protein